MLQHINFEYVGHAAYTLGILSFMLKEMLWLRIATIVSASLCIVYNYAAPIEPMWVPIYWNSALVGINLIQIAIFYHEQRDISFDEKERWLYSSVFSNFSPVEFKRLMKLASWRSSDAGETLVNEGQDDSDLILITKGKCDVILDQHPVAQLNDGDFIGEMSLLSGKAASATVATVGTVDYVSWERAKLQKMLSRSPSIQSAIRTAMSNQLTEKVVRSSKQRGTTTLIEAESD